MTSQDNKAVGPITDLLAEDHRRLDTLLDSALADPGKVDGQRTTGSAPASFGISAWKKRSCCLRSSASVVENRFPSL